MTIPGGYYIKARKIQESDISMAPPHIREIWDWFLKEANHKDNKHILRGQCVRTYRDIQDGLKWFVGWRKHTYSKSQCETAMKWLKKHGMVTTAKTTRGMIVTVCNYDHYQTPENYENHKPTKRKATREPQTDDTINKNGKNGNNKILYDFYVKTINPARKSPARALKNINTHLNKYDFEKLNISVLNYKVVCGNSEPQFCKDPANFFGMQEPTFIDYLPENFDPPADNNQQQQRRLE